MKMSEECKVIDDVSLKERYMSYYETSRWWTKKPCTDIPFEEEEEEEEDILRKNPCTVDVVLCSRVFVKSRLCPTHTVSSTITKIIII